MAINGAIKFFNRNQALEVDGSTITSTSAAAPEFALDRNPLTYLRSVGSNDVTTETIVVIFPSSVTFNRLLFLDHNWKQFTVKYDVAGVWTNFTSVVGLDGSLGGGISETTFADNTAYYEVASVSSTKIQIIVTSTQVANAEKYVSQIIVTDELGTLQGFPTVQGLTFSRSSRETRTLSGRAVVQKSGKTFAVGLNFITYPTSTNYQADLELMFSLFDRDDNFLIWLCGGRRGSTYFKYAPPGWRLKDCFEVQVIGDLSPEFLENVYINPLNLQIGFQEAV